MDFDNLSDETRKLLSDFDEKQLVKLIKDEKARALMGGGKVKKRQFSASIPEPLHVNFFNFCSLEGAYEGGAYKVSASGALTWLLVTFLQDKKMQKRFYDEYSSFQSSKRKVSQNKSRVRKKETSPTA